MSTVTLTGPPLKISANGIAAVSWVELTNVVVRDAPPHCTNAPDTKFVPLTVRVNPRPPAVAVAGDKPPIALIVGVGLLIVNVAGPDAPPPGVGFTTVILGVPLVAM